MKKIISNDIVTLRSLEVTDLDVLYKWENDSWLWTVSNIMSPSPKSYLWQYLQNYDSDIYTTRQLRLMITLTETGEPVGTVDLTNFDPFNNRAEFGIMIDKAHGGKGLGDAALRLTIGYVRDYLGLYQIYSLVPASNTVCISLLKKHGFTTAGLLKKWINHGTEIHDVEMMQLIF
ncbi:MAG: GNAT family N-acetyltransferase [Muribaculaceae bacterium]|nr:GNAT family N-acetyltransferase [Muribaculaceae bacterium]MBR5117324.1 GNAT family N-acetyltransferase [Muribaculaceae bacterium]